MANKQKQLKRHNSKRFTKQQITIGILTIVVAVLVLAVAIGGWFIAYLWQIVRSESGTTVKILITQAVEGLSSPAPIDGPTGRVYLPQARLSLDPLPDTIGSEIRYQFLPAWEDMPQEIRIVNGYGVMSARSNLVGTPKLEEAFAAVPELQACSRGYLLSFNEQSQTADTLKFKKTLSDGRQLYVYLDAGCSQYQEDFENYLKTVDTY